MSKVLIPKKKASAHAMQGMFLLNNVGFHFRGAAPTHVSSGTLILGVGL